jgi:hypothetical protein
MKYFRRTTSAVAGNGRGSTINEHSPAKHNECRLGQRPGHHDQVPAKNNERRRGHRPKHHDELPTTHNSPTHTHGPRDMPRWGAVSSLQKFALEGGFGRIFI